MKTKSRRRSKALFLSTKEKLLRHRYLDLQKSTLIIARDLDCSKQVILNWMRKFQIPIRDRSHAHRVARSNHVTLTNEALQFLSGELLGDGHLEHFEWSSVYKHSSKHERYLEWLSKKLECYGIAQCGRITEREGMIRIKGKIERSYIAFQYCSLRYVELKPLQQLWYRPSTEEERRKGRKFIKVVPEDLVLTPLTCRQWYLGDGFLQEFGAAFSTQSFTRDEVYFLASLLIKLGFKTTVRKDRSARISATVTKDFLNYIGSCPEGIRSTYGYKWYIGRN